MCRSDKTTLTRRVQDVLRLLLAGAEFAEIRQFANVNGWDVSDRQVRRYVEAAYCRVAKIARRDRVQLLGRHLMQRRALYVRAIKDNDLGTALKILKDEAALQWLYPKEKSRSPNSPTELAQRHVERPIMSRRHRVARLVQAETKGDRIELALLRKTARHRSYRFEETMVPYLMLQIMAQMYVGEQLDAAANYLLAITQAKQLEAIATDENEGDADALRDDALGDWTVIAMTTSYRFCIGKEAWDQFTADLGVDGEHLVRGNHQGTFLEMHTGDMCRSAPSAEELSAVLEADKGSDKRLTTAHDLAESWKRMFAKVSQDW